MNPKVNHPDTVTLVETTTDGYGDKTVTRLIDIDATFLTGWSQSFITQVEQTGSTAHVYLDVDNEYLIQKKYRIEGYYLICNEFNVEEENAWYRIERVKIGQRKLLSGFDEVNNIHCYLSKSDPLTIPPELENIEEETNGEEL